MIVEVEPWQASITFFLIFSVPATLWLLIIKFCILPRREIAEGEVIRIREKTFKSENSGYKTHYSPVYMFTDKFGHCREVSSEWYSNRYPEIGTIRRLYYDPYKPARFSVAGLKGIFLGPTILFSIALFLCFIPLSQYF
jgi:hypothetical protein